MRGGHLAQASINGFTSFLNSPRLGAHLFAGGTLPKANPPANPWFGVQAATAANPGKKATHPNLILGICCMSLLIVGMDVTIVNVALPAIQHDLHATLSGLQWILDAYTLVVASLLMLSGSMSDRFGRRRVFQIGLVMLTTA